MGESKIPLHPQVTHKSYPPITTLNTSRKPPPTNKYFPQRLYPEYFTYVMSSPTTNTSPRATTSTSNKSTKRNKKVRRSKNPKKHKLKEAAPVNKSAVPQTSRAKRGSTEPGSPLPRYPEAKEGIVQEIAPPTQSTSSPSQPPSTNNSHVTTAERGLAVAPPTTVEEARRLESKRIADSVRASIAAMDAAYNSRAALPRKWVLTRDDWVNFT
jgi:predicted component of type VI protein secretion system